MPRRTLSTNTAWDDIYNYVVYVEITLSLAADDGDKELGALVAPLRKLLDKWRTLDVERRTRATAVIRANALVALRDLGLDTVTTELHNALLATSAQNRQAPQFTRFFPRPLYQVVKLSLEPQLGVARTLLHKLGQDETPAAVRKAHEKPLKDSIAAGEAAIKGREVARATAQDLTTQVAALRAEANAALLTVEGSLKTVAGKRGLGTEFVNAFFPGVITTKRSAKPEPAAAAPAAS